MNKKQIVASLVKIANELDENGFIKTALDVDEVLKRIQNGYYEAQRMKANLSDEENLNSQMPDPNSRWNNATRENLQGRKIYNEDSLSKYEIVNKYRKAYENGNLKDNTIAEVRILLNAELEENGFRAVDEFQINRMFYISPTRQQDE